MGDDDPFCLNQDMFPSDQFPWVAALDSDQWRFARPDEATPLFPRIRVKIEGSSIDVIGQCVHAMESHDVPEQTIDFFTQVAGQLDHFELVKLCDRWFSLQ